MKINNLKIKLTINNLYFIFLVVLFEFSLLFIIKYVLPLESHESINIIVLLGLIQIILSFIVFRFIEKRYFSYISIFFLLLSIFHFGQFVLYIGPLNIPVDMIFNIKTSNRHLLSETTGYIIECFILFTLGSLLYYLTHSHANIQSKYLLALAIKKKYPFALIALFMTIIGFILKFYLDINKTIIFFSQGYGATYDFKSYGFVSLFSTFFEYGIAVLLLVNFDHIKKRNRVLLIFLFVEGFSLISGSRAKVFVWSLVLFIIYITLSPTVKPFKSIKYVFFGFIGLCIIVIIGIFRNSSDKTLSFFSQLPNFQIFDFFSIVLAEMGSTINSVYNSIFTFPKHFDFSNGKNYIVGLLTVFPNINSLNIFINDIVFFPKRFSEGYGMFAGGSIIGETYYAFGHYGSLLFIVIGYYIEKISSHLSLAIQTKNVKSFILILPFLGTMLWWNRDYFSSMIREWIWMSCILFILLASSLLSSKNIQRDKYEH